MGELIWALVTLVVFIAAFWSLVFLIDTLAQTSFGDAYASFLSRHGLFVGFARLEWYSTAAVSRLSTWVWRLPRFSIIFYLLGGVAALVSGLGALGILVYSIAQQASFLSHVLTADILAPDIEAPAALLVPLLPGVNVPLRHVPPLLLSLLLSAIIHESGHLLAALRVRARVRGFGVMLMAVVPAAYVDLPDPLEAIDAWRAFVVASAGVWHNVVLSLMAILLLFSGPTLSPILPYRVIDNGVLLTHVDPAYGPSLRPGDVLIALDSCQVNSPESWQQCIVAHYEHNFTQRHGWCVRKQTIEQISSKSSALPCCELDGDPNDPDSLCWTIPDHDPICAHVNDLGISEAPACDLGTSCSFEDGVPRVCTIPKLQGSLLLRVRVRRGQEEVAVLVLAHPYALHAALSVTKWQPIFHWLPLWLPDYLARQLWFLFSVSSGLALLNSLPVGALDGTLILTSLLRMTSFSASTKHQVSHTAAVVTSTLLALAAASALIAQVVSWWIL